MELNETLARLTRHPVFKEWHSKNKKYFLAHAFVMLDDVNKDDWQIGFYNAELEKMITFIVCANSVKHTPEQEVLKSDIKIEKLKAEDVTIEVKAALEIAKKCFEENYKQERAMKQFFIIQEVEGKAVFNLTYLTQSFKTVNMKIDAKDGTLTKHSIQVLAQFG